MLILDFNDSFTFNLQHILVSLEAQVDVVLDEFLELSKLENYSHVILSPGPGLPSEKKNLFNLIARTNAKIPLLGVCLGMQGIAQYFGLDLYNLNTVRHGVSEMIEVDTSSILFDGLPRQFNVGLYHSWAVDSREVENLKFTAMSKSGIVMALENVESKIFGLQFHPESIMTDFGHEIINNFLKFE